MRQVYMPRDGIRFRPDPVHVAQFLPEVRQAWLTFLQPTPQDPALCSDLAKELILDFVNGTRLTLSGAYLWKFCDAIPPELGSDDIGWHDVNPYGPGDTEWLMRRIRAAYLAMFEQEEIDYTVRPPLRAHIDFRSMTTAVEFPAELTEATREQLGAWLSLYLDRISERFLGWFAELARTALQQPRNVLERYPMRDGLIGQAYVTRPWPVDDPQNSLTLKSFMAEFGPEEGTPWRRTYRAIVAEQLTVELRRGLIETLRKLKRTDASLLANVIDELRIYVPPSGQLRVVEVNAALAESREEEWLFCLFYRYVFPEDSLPLSAYMLYD